MSARSVATLVPAVAAAFTLAAGCAGPGAGSSTGPDALPGRRAAEAPPGPGMSDGLGDRPVDRPESEATAELLPGDVPVVATGVASGTDEAAVDHATLQALRRAVAKVLGPDGQADRPVRERIVRLTRSFVRRSRVVSEERAGDGVAVTVEAVVDTVAVEEELAAIRRELTSRRLPRLLIVVGPLDGGAPTDVARIAQNAVEATFAGLGFATVDLEDERLAGVARRVYAAFEGKQAGSVAEAGRSVGAEVAVVGRARQPSEVAVRAVHTGTGSVVFASRAVGEPNVDEKDEDLSDEEALMKSALVDAARGLARECAEAVVGVWRQKPPGARGVTVRVRGVSFLDFARLRRATERVRGVQLVSALPYSGETGELDVLYVGDALDLARSMTLLPEMPLKVVSAGAETIVLEPLSK